MTDRELQDQLRIDAYLEGGLSPKDQVQFEKELESNPDLRETLAITQGLKEMMAARAFREKITPMVRDAISANEKGNAQDSHQDQGISLGAKMLNSKVFRYSLSIAAGFAILLALFHLFDRKAVSPLYAKYYESYQPDSDYNYGDNLTGNPTPDESEIQQRLEDAIKSYEEKNYKEVLSLLDTTIISKSSPLPALYRGLAYMELRDEVSAESNLLVAAQTGFLEDHENSFWVAPAKWYLALLYLNQDRIALSKELLKELAGTETPFQKRAINLLGEI